MSTDPTADFLAALEKSGLLAAADLAHLKAWAKRPNVDAAALAKEINQRDWLTAYQIKEVYRGRGAALTVGPFVLLDLIGEGGMGKVFKAKHTRLGRDVALKVIRQEKLSNPLAIQRFQQEVQAVAQLSHPNVVLAFDAGEVAGTHYFAMEYIDGTDLTKLVRDRGPLPIQEACEYVRQSAVGLHHAFERGLVHRDVKPSNLIAAKGGTVKVLDLGLALLNDPGEGGTKVTQDGYVIGTPDFVAPEQARNPHAVDTRADVYALGCTLFYLLTGKVPFDAPTAHEKLIRHCTDPPPSLLPHRPDVSPHLDAVVRWMMAKKPEDRPQTPMHAAGALQPFCPPPRTGSHQLPSSAVLPVFAPPEAERSSQLFRITAAEDSPAVIRERDRKRADPLAVGVALAAVVAVLVGGYFVYRQTAAQPPPLPEAFAVEKIGLRMIRLEGGTFRMGSPPAEADRNADEGPAGDVTLSGPFYVSSTEVTHGQFKEVIGASPAVHASRAPARVGNDMPVDSVTWDEAVEFCRKLTQYDRSRRAGWAYRLPTEAEWEYACRGGKATRFWCGDDPFPGEHAVFTPKENPFNSVKPPTMPQKVGGTKANPFGLFDLHGNVAEWVADSYAKSYPDGPRENPTGPAGSDLRVIRGGSFADAAGPCRSAARRGLAADKRDPTVGFRVVFAPTP